MRSSTSSSLAASERSWSRRLSELLLDLLQLLLDDLAHQLGVGEDALVVGDLLAQLRQLLLDLVALQAGQAAQAHLEDGRGLLLGEAEALGEALGGLRVGASGADDVMTSSMLSRAMM